MSLILHRRNLTPLIFPNGILLHRAQSLLAREASEDKNSSFTNGNGMRISALIHRCLIQDFILLGHVNASILLRRGPTASDQYFRGTQSNRSGTLIKLVVGVVWQLFKCPLVFVYVVAEAHFRVDVVTE